MKNLGDVLDSIRNMISLIKKLPNKIIEAMQTAAKDVTSIVQPILDNIIHLKEPFEFTGTMIKFMAEEATSLKDESAKLRCHLKTYLEGVEGCVKQVNSLSKKTGSQLPLLSNPQFASDVIEKVLIAIPDIALLPVAKALNSQQGWENHPHEILKGLENLTEKVSSKDEKDQADIDLAFQTIGTFFEVANGVLKLIKDLIARDLTAVAAVGAGGGGTVAANPVRWPFVEMIFVIDQLGIAVSYAHDLVKHRRKVIST